MAANGIAQLLSTPTCKFGRGHMAAMERLLAAGSPIEPTAEELAHENVAVKMVQREMSEADEANLLEEEDMHVFDREPLADRLPLVSCNTCKKPVKASQYSAHAERCRALTATDDSVTEIDGGANHKKPPRKARKKLLVAQDKDTVTTGEKERLHSLDIDDALPDSVGTSAGDSQDQGPGRSGYTNSRGQKRGMNIGEGTVLNSSKAGRPRKTSFPVSPDGSTSAEDGSRARTGSTSTLLTHAELDVMCGVIMEQGAPCRQPLTCKVHCEPSKRAVTGRRRPYDVLLQELKASMNRLRSSKVHDSGVDPLPMTTKVYYLRHRHRMRAVLGNLFQESCARESTCSPGSNSLYNGQGALAMTKPALSIDNCVLELDAPQQRIQCQPSDKLVDQNRGLAAGLVPLIGSLNQSDSKFSAAATFNPSGQFIFGKGCPAPHCWEMKLGCLWSLESHIDG